MGKIRACDLRCHNAKGAICKCWCNGRYHGKGHERANELFGKDFYWTKPVKGKTFIDDQHGQPVLFCK